MGPNTDNSQNKPIETNIASQNITPTINSHNNKRPFYICLCFAIITTITAGIFAYLYFSNLGTTTDQTQTEQPDANNRQDDDALDTTNKETVISDTNLISNLDEKMLILHHANYPDSQQFENSIFISSSVGYEIPLYATGTLSDIVKLVHLIASIPESDFHVLSEAEKQSIQTTESLNPGLEYITTGIDADIVNTKYKSLYGNDIVHGTLNNNNTYCPQYNYNKEYHIYYGASFGCGGKWDSARQYYKYKYTTDNNHAYVYVAAGAIVISDNGEELMTCDVVETNNAQPCGDVPENYFYNKTPFINSSNYQKFANYRFIFNRADDNTYYFSKVEKL